MQASKNIIRWNLLTTQENTQIAFKKAKMSTFRMQNCRLLWYLPRYFLSGQSSSWDKYYYLPNYFITRPVQLRLWDKLALRPQGTNYYHTCMLFGYYYYYTVFVPAGLDLFLWKMQCMSRALHLECMLYWFSHSNWVWNIVLGWE